MTMTMYCLIACMCVYKHQVYRAKFILSEYRCIEGATPGPCSVTCGYGKLTTGNLVGNYKLVNIASFTILCYALKGTVLILCVCLIHNSFFGFSVFTDFAACCY